MDNLEGLELVIGFVAPIVISVILQPNFNRFARVAVMVVFSILAGFGVSYFKGDLNGLDIVSTIITVAVTSIATYKGIFEPLGVSPWVENATSITSKPQEAPEAPQTLPQTRREARALREAQNGR